MARSETAFYHVHIWQADSHNPYILFYVYQLVDTGACKENSLRSPNREFCVSHNSCMSCHTKQIQNSSGTCLLIYHNSCILYHTEMTPHRVNRMAFACHGDIWVFFLELFLLS